VPCPAYRFSRSRTCAFGTWIARPATTDGPKESTFVVYWEFRDLRELEDHERFLISELRTE
jgi:hypothetical protein